MRWGRIRSEGGQFHDLIGTLTSGESTDGRTVILSPDLGSTIGAHVHIIAWFIPNDQVRLTMTRPHPLYASLCVATALVVWHILVFVVIYQWMRYSPTEGRPAAEQIPEWLAFSRRVVLVVSGSSVVGCTALVMLLLLRLVHARST